MPSQTHGNVLWWFVMELLQWHKVCKIGGDEVHRTPVVALNSSPYIGYEQSYFHLTRHGINASLRYQVRFPGVAAWRGSSHYLGSAPMNWTSIGPHSHHVVQTVDRRTESGNLASLSAQRMYCYQHQPYTLWYMRTETVGGQVDPSYIQFCNRNIENSKSHIVYSNTWLSSGNNCRKVINDNFQVSTLRYLLGMRWK